MHYIFLILFLLVSCGVSSTDIVIPKKIRLTNNPVERHGYLSVDGQYIVDQYGNTVQLKGMSSHGLQWFGNYANYNTIKELRDNWGQNVFRAAMYTAEGGYLSNPSLKNKVHQIVEDSRVLGVYVVIDWHILSDRNPMWNIDKAKLFFAEMAKTYAKVPNVIYEVANEPNGSDVTWWNSIKPYATEVIKEIRKYSPGIIIVGTANWSQNIQDPAMDPIIGENIVYACHFYAGTHGQWLRDRVNQAFGKGISIFVSEWGGMSASGGGGINYWEVERWMELLDSKKISWAAWSLSNSNQTHSVLKPWASTNGGWSENDLSDHGRMIKRYMLR